MQEGVNCLLRTRSGMSDTYPKNDKDGIGQHLKDYWADVDRQKRIETYWIAKDKRDALREECKHNVEKTSIDPKSKKESDFSWRQCCGLEEPARLLENPFADPHYYDRFVPQDHHAGHAFTEEENRTLQKAGK